MQYVLYCGYEPQHERKSICTRIDMINVFENTKNKTIASKPLAWQPSAHVVCRTDHCWLKQQEESHSISLVTYQYYPSLETVFGLVDKQDDCQSILCWIMAHDVLAIHVPGRYVPLTGIWIYSTTFLTTSTILHNSRTISQMVHFNAASHRFHVDIYWWSLSISTHHWCHHWWWFNAV